MVTVKQNILSEFFLVKFTLKKEKPSNHVVLYQTEVSHNCHVHQARDNKNVT